MTHQPQGEEHRRLRSIGFWLRSKDCNLKYSPVPQETSGLCGQPSAVMAEIGRESNQGNSWVSYHFGGIETNEGEMRTYVI